MASIFNENERKVRKLRKIATEIDKLSDRYSFMSDDDLAAQTGVFKERLASGATLDDILLLYVKGDQDR